MKYAFIASTAMLFAACLPTNNQSDSIPDISSSFTSPALGCSNFEISLHDPAYTKFLVISGVTDSLGIDTTPEEFNIVTDSSFLKVYIDTYDIENGTQWAGCFNYCSDILCADFNISPVKWPAISGSVKINRSPVNDGPAADTYEITIELIKVTFKDPVSEVQAKIDYLRISKVVVGFYPG